MSTQHPRGLMEHHTNPLNKHRLHLYTLVWLGCLLSYGTGSLSPGSYPARSEQNAQIRFKTSAKPDDTFQSCHFITFLVSNATASFSGRFLCRRQPKKRPNSGDSRVDRNPPNEPNSPPSGRADCRTRHHYYVICFDPPPNDHRGWWMSTQRH